MREKFTFLKNFKDAADRLPDDLRLKFYDSITKYAFEGIEPDDAIISALIGAIKPSLDTEEKRGGARDGAGRKSKEIKINQNNQKNQNEFFEKIENFEKNQNNQNIQKEKKISPLNPLEENKNILPPYTLKGVVPPKGDDHQIDLEEWIKENKQEPLPAKQTKFKKPTLDEVEAYMSESGYAVSAERFIAYYDSVGWKVGKNPMKDWKAALRGWAIREQARERTLRAASGLVGVRSETYGEGIPL